MRKPIALMSGFLWFAPGAGLAEPTVQQTIDYINNTYKSCTPFVEKFTGNDGLTTTHVYEDVVFAIVGKQLVMTESLKSIYSVPSSSSGFSRVCNGALRNMPTWAHHGTTSRLCPFAAHKYSFVASVVVPTLSTEVGTKGKRIVIECHSASDCIRTVKSGREIMYNGESAGIDKKGRSRRNYLGTCGDKTIKLKKAVSHLIGLLGGKKELF